MTISRGIVRRIIVALRPASDAEIIALHCASTIPSAEAAEHMFVKSTDIIIVLAVEGRVLVL